MIKFGEEVEDREGQRGSDKDWWNWSDWSNERREKKVELNIYLKMDWTSGLFRVLQAIACCGL